MLFDGAWLWEKYIGSFITCLTQTDNDTGENGQRVYKKEDGKKNKSYYPDFFKKDKLVLDAKYKTLENMEISAISRDDTYQILSYIFLLNAKQAGFIYPASKESPPKVRTIKNKEQKIFSLGLAIPQDAEDYSSFCQKMEEAEQRIKQYIDHLLSSTP